MTVTSGREPGAILTSVDAVILDDGGTIVAQRTLTDRSPRVCLPLARAVGAWASLVLDAEMNRAKDDDLEGRSSGNARSSPSWSSSEPSLAAGAGRDGWVQESRLEPSAPSFRHALEVGTMLYLRNGLMPTGGMAGVSPFVTVELRPSWVLRPAMFFGRSTGQVGLASGEGSSLYSHLAVRTDLCRRIPGNYIERRGIEADLCAGAEGGLVIASSGTDERAARVGLGPSVNMRGELGAGVALEIRGLVGANLLRYAGEQTPLVFASGELGMSVRFP